MASFDGMKLTNDGIDLQGKVQAGATLNFTRIAIGDGELIGSLVDLTELINETFSLEIQQLDNLGGGKTQVKTTLVNQDNPEGSFIREIGLFADDPDKGEILYSVANAGDQADHLPPSNGPDVFEELITLIIFAGNDAEVSATIQQTVNPTLEQHRELETQVNDHENNKNNPHGVTVEQIGAETPTGAQEKADLAEAKAKDSQTEVTRNTAHSGFLSLSDFDLSEPNKIKMISDTVLNVNGYLNTIPAGTTFDLPEAPTVGSREDLAFLEFYFPIDGNGHEMTFRTRTVAGVDFDTYSEGISDHGINKYVYKNLVVKPQGGNTDPIESQTDYVQFFGSGIYNNNYAGAHSNSKFFLNFNDAGLFLAGDGTQNSKDLLQTADGYVYAVPMFRIPRRNSGGYSVENGNGAREYVVYTLTQNSTNHGQDDIETLSFINIVGLSVGNIIRYKNLGEHRYEIITVNNDTIGVKRLSQGTAQFWTGYEFNIESDRPNNLYSNIIDQRDIIDLRHKVREEDYNKILNEEFNRLLAGENGNVEMKKEYFGLQKAVTDEHTIFYASFDGTLNAEVGTNPVFVSDPSYRPSPTGLGAYRETFEDFSISDLDNTMAEMTIDMLLKVDRIEETNKTLIQAGWASTRGDIRIRDAGINIGKFNHVRLIINNEETTAYVNGNLVNSYSFLGVDKTALLTIQLGEGSDVGGRSASGLTISELHISSTDRGESNLPKDLIDGYSNIQPKFTEKRRVFSDAQTSQRCLDKIDVLSNDHLKHIEVSQVVEGVWSVGDTIKVKGYDGIVSGVIDEDTAISEIISYADGHTHKDLTSDSTKFKVSDVSKLSIGDTYNLW
ncbi:hypothetical protein [Chengkuizengella axinellae]|uniref:Uncharacterized protein n=1 Tax=Chengkuizengella axinellae TaxID=3064388 RepID=A0ABT9J4W0_9BACL|nr:hypothetical protein [Chengkuizengella sp. 2205SS18-9]MDP5276635.1 hypothetical protein [Chengkuizengella sp. 2205SS18-9]